MVASICHIWYYTKLGLINSQMLIHRIHNQKVTLKSLVTTNSPDVGQEVLSAHVGVQLSL